MGTKLIIKGADFSKNGIAKEDAPFAKVNYLLTTSSSHKITSPVPFTRISRSELTISIAETDIAEFIQMFGFFAVPAADKSMLRLTATSTDKIIAYINSSSYVELGNRSSLSKSSITFDISRNKVICNGITKSITDNGTAEDISVAIIGCNGYTASGFAGIGLYSYKQWSDRDDDASLVVDAIPVKKKDGTICLYDKISGSYIYVDGGENPSYG